MHAPSIGLALALSTMAGTLAAVLMMKPLPEAEAVSYHAGWRGNQLLDDGLCLGYVALNLELGTLEQAKAIVKLCRKDPSSGPALHRREAEGATLR